MEKSQGVSFIPKQPVRGERKPRMVRKVYVFTYITLVFFFMTLVSSGVVAMLTLNFNKQLEEEKSRLSLERKDFNEDGLESVREFDARVDIASNLLHQQVAVSRIFEKIEAVVAGPVLITSFSYEKTLEDGLALSLIAETDAINATVFQRNVLAKDTFFKDAHFKEVELATAEVTTNNPYALELTTILSEDVITFLIEKTVAVSEIAYNPTVYEAEVEESETDSSNTADIAE